MINDRQSPTYNQRHRSSGHRSSLAEASGPREAGAWDESIGEVLGHLGRATGVSRVYIFENHTAPDGALLTSQRHEWVAPGIPPLIDNPDLQDLPYVDGGFERWMTTLSRGEAIAGPVREFPETERAVLEDRDICSILVLPVFAGETWWGFIGFDECRNERDWSLTGQAMLRAAASAIGSAVQQRRVEEQLRRLASAATDVTASLDLTQVLSAIAASALDLVQAANAHIYLYNPDKKDAFTFGTALWKNGRRAPAVRQVRPHGLTATVARSGQRMVIDDAAAHPLFAEPTARAWEVKSIAGFPLRRAGRVVGVLNVAFDRQCHRLTEDELQVLSLLANQAAIAIENARLHEQIRRQAVIDELTGLHNHRYFYEALGEELTRSQRYQYTCTLIMLDLDDFKQYNDRYGHLAGDDLLRELGRLIRDTTRKTDITARYGGEEFALVLPHTDSGQAHTVAQRLRNAIRSHEFAIPGDQQVGQITASFGLAAYPSLAQDERELVHAADMALLRAKAAGKDRVCA